MIHIAQFAFNPFQENTYILHCTNTKEAIIIDAGCFSAAEQNTLSRYIESNELKPVGLYNTHCHIDHVLGNQFIAERYNLPLHLHRDELFTYNDANKWVAMLGIAPLIIPDKQVYIDERSSIVLGNSELQVAFTPGHSVASLCFYNINERIAVCGDVLFKESIGRTDLPGGNFDTLIRSIRSVCFTWPDDMIIYSGHGEPTTIGHEKKFNPFVKAAN